MKALIHLAFFLFCLLALSTSGIVNASSVTINEIAWMGTEISHADEWIELYNNTNSSILLNGWILKAVDGTPNIILEGTIPAQGFFLLERTNNNTVPNIAADQIYTGALSNDGENLELYNNLSELIDSINYEDGWLVGDNTTKQTMERKDVQAWQTSQNPGGTPKNENSITIKTESSPKTNTEIAFAEEPKIVYPSNVVINEILPSPAGPDSEEEWIEIFNKNNFQVSLFNWQLADTVGKISVYTFPKGTTMQPKSFLVLNRTTSKITMNNSGDTINLILPDGNIIDTTSYGKARKEESFNKTDFNWVWSSTLTPGAQNITPVPIEKETAQETKSIETEVYENNTAAIVEHIPQTNPAFLIILFVALPIAIFLGTMTLILKKRLKYKKLS